VQSQLFADVPPQLLREALAYFHETRTYAPHDLIVTEGKAERELYLLEEGSAMAKVSGKVVGSLQVDDVFGEVGFCASGKRSASVFAGPEGALTRIISPERFASYAAKQPAIAFIMARNLAFLLASKLQRTNRQLRANIGRVDELEEELSQHQQVEPRRTSLLGRLFSSLGST